MEAQEWSLLSRPCFWKVVRVLIREGEVNISYLLHSTRLNYVALKRCLEDMERAGIVRLYKIGRLRVVALNWAHFTTPLIHDLVRALEGRSST